MSSAPPSPDGSASTGGGNGVGTAADDGGISISISTLNNESGWAGDARMLHGVCMFVALNLMPLAALVVARFLKSRLRWWMSLHVALLVVAVVAAAVGVYQLVPSASLDYCNNTTLASTSLATTTTVAATALLPTATILATSSLPTTPSPTATPTTTSYPGCNPNPQFPLPSSPSFWFGTPHAALGSLLLFGFLPILIAAGAYVGATWDATRTRSPPAARVHRWAGRAFLAVVTIETQLGLSQSNAPIAFSIIFWILTLGVTAMLLLFARKLPPAHTLQMPKPPHWASRETLRRKVEASFDFASSPFSTAGGGSGSGGYGTGSSSSSSSSAAAAAARRPRLPRLNSNSVNPVSSSPLAPTSTSASAVSVASSSRVSSSDIAGGGASSLTAAATRVSESSSTVLASSSSATNSSVYYQNSASSSSAVSPSFRPSASAIALFQKATTLTSITTTLKSSVVVSGTSPTTKRQQHPAASAMSIDQQKQQQRIGSESPLVVNHVVLVEPEQLSQTIKIAKTMITIPPRNDDNEDDYDKKLVDRIIYSEPQEISLPRTIIAREDDNSNNEQQNRGMADRIIFSEPEEMSLPRIVNRDSSDTVPLATVCSIKEGGSFGEDGNGGGGDALMKRVIFAEPEEMEEVEEGEGLHYHDLPTIHDRIIYQEPLSLSRHGTANSDDQ
ncbi:hypothetical protein HK100_005380 [Physocladia obscura]|uniref:Uncharacterized protein n=1 Tax=Physocladia obscura TaxID=109957 RepID=A0AAD5ST72_9FUNG|nr:hypothetical protein HK100_005380 [Physocladia obscura]